MTVSRRSSPQSCKHPHFNQSRQNPALRAKRQSKNIWSITIKYNLISPWKFYIFPEDTYLEPACRFPWSSTRYFWKQKTHHLLTINYIFRPIGILLYLNTLLFKSNINSLPIFHWLLLLLLIKFFMERIYGQSKTCC